MSQTNGTSDLDFEEVREILDAYFVSGDLEEALDGIAPGTLFDHIAECERSRDYFNELSLADRGIDGGEIFGASGDFERGLGDAAFGDALDDMLAEEAAGDGSGPSSGDDPNGGAEVVSLFGASGRTVGTLAAAALAALVFGAMLFGPFESTTPDGDDDFRARSAATQAQPGQFATPQLQVFCAERSRGEVAFRGSADTPGAGLECPLDAEIKLAYSNRSDKLLYGSFFGVGQDGTLYWYGPTPAVPEPVRIRTTEEVVPFGETIRLSVNHRPGRVRIHAVFSTRPLGFEELSRRMELRQGADLHDQPRIEFDGLPTASTSTTMTVVEETNR